MDYSERKDFENLKNQNKEWQNQQRANERQEEGQKKRDYDSEKEKQKRQDKKEAEDRKRRDKEKDTKRRRDEDLNASTLDNETKEKINAENIQADAQNLDKKLEAERENIKYQQEHQEKVTKQQIEASKELSLIQQENNLEAVTRQLEGTMEQMGLTHEQQKELITLYLDDHIERENVAEQRARFEHERDLVVKRVLHEQYLEAEERHQQNQLYMKEAESLIFQIAEVTKGIREKELAKLNHKQTCEHDILNAHIDIKKADQAHSQACEYDTVKTKNEMMLEWEKAKIRVWEANEMRKGNQAQARKFADDFQNNNSTYEPYS